MNACDLSSSGLTRGSSVLKTWMPDQVEHDSFEVVAHDSFDVVGHDSFDVVGHDSFDVVGHDSLGGCA